MLAHLHHLRGQDAGRAVEGGEGLVQLSHVAANGRLSLDQIDVIPGVGQLQRGGDAGDASAHHQRVRVDLHGPRLQGRMMSDATHRALDQGLGLLRGRGAVVCGPGIMLADVGHLEHVGIQPRALARAAESLLMHVRRARGHHHPRQPIFPDIVLDQILAEA